MDIQYLFVVVMYRWIYIETTRGIRKVALWRISLLIFLFLFGTSKDDHMKHSQFFGCELSLQLWTYFFIDLKGEVITLRFDYTPTRKTITISHSLRRPRETLSFMLDLLNHFSFESLFQYSPNTIPSDLS